MRKKKFLENLSKLPVKDFRAFWNYSNLHCKSDNVSHQLLTYFKKYHPDFDRYELDERYAYAKIFKEEDFNKRKIDGAISDLRKRLKEFLLGQSLKKTSFEKDFLLWKILDEYGLDNLAEKQFKKLQLNLENTSEKDMWFLMNQLRIAHEKYYNINLEKIALQAPRIEEVMNALDTFLKLSKLKYSCEVFTRKNVINESTLKVKYLDEVISGNQDEKNILLQCYQIALKLIQEKRNDEFYFLKRFVFENIEFINQRDRHILISYLTNFASYKIKTGNQSFAFELLEFYKEGIEINAFIIGGYFHDMHFGNIVDVGCRLNQYNWSEQFIQNWGGKLPEEIKEEMISFTKAFILYEKKDFELALELLKKDFKKNPFYTVKAKWLEIICYFESDADPVEILKKCNNLKQFVRRNDVIHLSWKKGVLAFLKFFDMLSNPNVNKRELLDDLENTPFILYKSWLINKINEIK